MPSQVVRSVVVGPGGAKKRNRSLAGINTHQRLLDAAELLFAEYGYEGTSLRIFADAAVTCRRR
jgi:AcrR family transcriptional regulator